MLQSRLGSFEGLHVADLFAGTGALGLEALSRGAAYCTFVESDRAALDALKRNVDRLGAGKCANIHAGTVEHAPTPRRRCDLVLMDPPYGTGLAQKALDCLAAQSWLTPAGWVGVELHDEALVLPLGFALDAERRFGKAEIWLIKHQSASLPPA